MVRQICKTKQCWEKVRPINDYIVADTKLEIIKSCQKYDKNVNYATDILKK